MAKIVNVQGMLAILDNGGAVDIRCIEGSPAIGRTVDYVDGVWKVVGGIQKECGK